jgi:hypothetical protein
MHAQPERVAESARHAAKKDGAIANATLSRRQLPTLVQDVGAPLPPPFTTTGGWRKLPACVDDGEQQSKERAPMPGRRGHRRLYLAPPDAPRGQ